MKINWNVRLRNKAFWAAIVPALLLVAQSVLRLCGVEWQPQALDGALQGLIEAVFALLAVLGVINDPTTAGWADSDRAMTYRVPGGEE